MLNKLRIGKVWCQSYKGYQLISEKKWMQCKGVLNKG